MLIALAAALAAGAPTAPAPCPADQVCDVPLNLSPLAVEALLGNRSEAWWIAGNVMTVVARRDGHAETCCAIQRPLHPIGRGLQAMAVRIPDVESAILDMMVMPSTRQEEPPAWRGRDAPAAPPRSPEETVRPLVRYHEIDSARLGEPRRFSVYVPAGLRPGQRVPVVYMPDGGWFDFYRLADAAARTGHASPVIMVGIDNARRSGPPACPETRCDPRSQELLVDIPDATPAQSRFEARARFTVEEVIPFVEAHYPALRSREGRATLGWSSGGSWALTMAARHPDTFGNVVALSVGWAPAMQTASTLRHGRALFAFGRLENDRFRQRTAQAAALARAAGAEVRLVSPNGGHAHATWEIAVAEALAWMFPPAG